MAIIRSVGYSLRDPDDDEAYQTLVGDAVRLALILHKGAAVGYGGTTVGGEAPTTTERCPDGA